MLEIIRSGLTETLAPFLEEMGVVDDEWGATVGRADPHVVGDVALPCFAFAKEAKMNPSDIAERLLGHLESSLADGDVSLPWCSGVIAAGGYLNLHLDRGWVMDQIGERWGPPSNPTLPPVGTVAGPDDTDVVLIEHTSANPNGPFHIGRARNAIIGDTLVRMQRLAGRRVCAEYYVDDLGKQVGMLAWALDNLTPDEVREVLEADGRSSEADARWVDKADHERVLWYQAANHLSSEQDKDDDAQSGSLLERDLPNIGQAVERLILGSEMGDDAVLSSFDAAYKPVLDGMLETLQRMGVSFDTFTHESAFLHNGDVDQVVERLKESDLAGMAENGALFLELAERGVSGESTKFFFQRGDGSSLYATRDIAYHIDKAQRSETMINIFGEDHRLHATQLGVALDEVECRSPSFVFYAFIKLPEGKMSTRQGRVVFMDDLLEEAVERSAELIDQDRHHITSEMHDAIAEAVGCGAVRFNIIRVAPEKGVTFRWEEALSFDGDSAPFIMYAHARSCSILRRLESLSEVIPETFDRSLLSEQGDAFDALLMHIMDHNDVLERVVTEHRPQTYARWALDLASAFNAFYRDCPVILDEVVDPVRAWMCQLAQSHLSRACWALGLEPLREM